MYPLHPNRRSRKLDKENSFRQPRWGLRKQESFWPKKVRENPRGKACFSLRIFPLLFPDAEHPGLAALPPGQKHNDTNSGLNDTLAKQREPSK